MAKKTIFQREYILDKAFEFVVEKGFDELSARNLGKYIGCSTQPLFKCFTDMDDLKHNLLKKMKKYYEDFAMDIIDYEDYLFSKNYAYVLFALKNPNIFRALFSNATSLEMNIEQWVNYYETDDNMDIISRNMYVQKKQARRLFRDVLLYCHGLACQIMSGLIVLSENDIKILIKHIIKQLNFNV